MIDYKEGIGLHDYGGQQVPRCAVAKLETQKSRWCSSVCMLADLRPKKRRFSLSLKAGENQCSSSEQPDKRNSLLLSLFVLFACSIDWMRPTHSSDISWLLRCRIKTGQVLGLAIDISIRKYRK